MDSLSTVVRFAPAFAVAALWAGLAGAAAEAGLTVAAVADDVGIVVIRDATGLPAAYAIGETVAGTSWRLARVHGGEATLRSPQPFKGAPLEVRVRVGQPLPKTPEPVVHAHGVRQPE